MCPVECALHVRSPPAAKLQMNAPSQNTTTRTHRGQKLVTGPVLRPPVQNRGKHHAEYRLKGPYCPVNL